MAFEHKPSYDELLSKTGYLTNELNRGKLLRKFLWKENAVQKCVIEQLKTLLINYQTKSSCFLGHSSCKINHLKYNYVRPIQLSQCQPKSSSRVIVKPKSKEAMGVVTLVRKVNQLQAKYGVPPPLYRPNQSLEDGVCPEFETMFCVLDMTF